MIVIQPSLLTISMGHDMNLLGSHPYDPSVPKSGLPIRPGYQGCVWELEADIVPVRRSHLPPTMMKSVAVRQYLDVCLMGRDVLQEVTRTRTFKENGT